MFDSELSIRAVGPRTWSLTSPLIWTGREGQTFTVPIGFVTDFASVPRFLRWLVEPYGPYTRAAVLHDWLLVELAGWSRRHLGNVVIAPMDGSDDAPPARSRDCDGIFRAAMADLGTPGVLRWSMWAAVRLASCFNADRAYGRRFWRDAPAAFGMLLLVCATVVIPVAALFVLLALGVLRILMAVTGGRPAPRKTRWGGPGGSRLVEDGDMTEQSGDGSKHLFRDSKLGVLVVGGATIALDAVLNAAIDGLTNLDMSGWSGWWTTLASAGVATGLGALTAYRAKRRKNRVI